MQCQYFKALLGFVAIDYLRGLWLLKPDVSQVTLLNGCVNLALSCGILYWIITILGCLDSKCVVSSFSLLQYRSTYCSSIQLVWIFCGPRISLFDVQAGTFLILRVQWNDQSSWSLVEKLVKSYRIFSQKCNNLWIFF